MRSPFLFPAPDTSADDERFIAASYRHWIGSALALLPLGTAIFADTKWVVAVGLATVLLVANEIAARLYDLCIRLRRTNLILREDK